MISWSFWWRCMAVRDIGHGLVKHPRWGVGGRLHKKDYPGQQCAQAKMKEAELTLKHTGLVAATLFGFIQCFISINYPVRW